MKKILFLLLVTVMGQVALAQVKTPAETELNKSRNHATAENKKHHKMGKHAKMAMMKELNLSDDQKAKLKEAREANKAKKEAILSDSKLTEEQKHEQLKEMHKAESKNMKGLLTDEQKKKMKEFKDKRKAERKNNRGMKEKKGEMSDNPVKNEPQ